MDPLDFLESEELLRFFRCKKTEMSCMENPHTFLRQLRDHNLVPEDRYQKASRMKNKEILKKAVYEILDWLEREKPQLIPVFWNCVFQDTIMNLYPTLRLLYNSLIDGSYHFYTKLPEMVEKEQKIKNKRKELSDEEEEQLNSVKKRKLRSRRVDDDDDDDDEQPGPSSNFTKPQRIKSKKISFSSPLKKGEKGDIWTWAIFQLQLPVTCGDMKGSLNKDRLAKGEKCIFSNKQWFTPGEFEKLAGKSNSKNWKCSIRCNGTPLGKLIQEGHLKSVKYKGGCKKAKKSLFSSDRVTAVSDGEKSEDENEDEEDQTSSNNTDSSTDDKEEEEESKMVFKVTCGAVAGTLHKTRFASGTCGKSIRTETSWMSPVEFVKEASGQTDASWKKDIKWQGNPLSVLIEKNTLRIHSLLCKCELCKPDQRNLDNEKNDDECFVCRSDEGEDLVECDACPRSFHKECHLPHVEDAILRDERPWICTFCVFNTTQPCRYSDELEMQAALSRQISQHMLECHYLLLYLCNADEEQVFALNPNLHVQNYSTVIQTPMWFGKVADKLQSKEYQTVGEFVSDVQLIFTNCERYNRNNAEFLHMGQQLKKLFDGKFKKVFSVCESTDN